MANKWLDKTNSQMFKILTSQVDFSVVLIGCNSEQSKKLKGLENVVAIGFVKERDRLSKLYSMADVFVNLTLVDTLPTVNIEALACGTPVITYNSGGSPELVDNSVGGIVNPGDSENLIKKIREIKKNGKNFYTLQCRSRAARLYEKTAQIKEYIDLYKSIEKL